MHACVCTHMYVDMYASPDFSHIDTHTRQKQTHTHTHTHTHLNKNLPEKLQLPQRLYNRVQKAVIVPGRVIQTVPEIRTGILSGCAV